MEIAIRGLAQGAIVSSSPNLLEPIARTALPVLKMASATILASVSAARSFPVRQGFAVKVGVIPILGARNRMSPGAQAVAMMGMPVPMVIIAIMDFVMAVR